MGRGSLDAADGTSSVNNSFWQNYMLGYDSFVLDPRLIKYDANVSFNTNHLTFGSDQDTRHNGQRGLGYSVNTSLFPDRPFPFTIELSRNSVTESGEILGSNFIRGGIVVLPGQAQRDVQTRNNTVALNWQLRADGLPHVDFGYRTSDSQGSGAGFDAEQQTREMHVGVSRETENMRHTLRFQRTSFDDLNVQSFNQHFNDLDYEFGSLLGRRTRVSAHAGRRSSFSLVDLPPQGVDPGLGAVSPPAAGKSDSTYATSNISFDPNSRVSLGLTGNVDEQKSGTYTTNSRLATTTARFEPLTGLSVSASGVYGSVGQQIGDVPITVLTRSGQVGSSYRAGIRWLEGSVSGTRSYGEDSAPDGRTGRVQSWSGNTSLSVRLGGANFTGGYERLHSDDALLELGNYDLRRLRSGLQFSTRRISLSGNWDRSNVDRGQSASFSHSLQNTYSASLAFHAGPIGTLTASGGGFDSRTDGGRDRTYFGGGNFESRIGRVTLLADLREESTSSFQSNLSQSSLFGFGRAEYRRRQFVFALEYRRNSQDLRSSQLPTAGRFSGRQLNLRVTRKFGFRL